MMPCTSESCPHGYDCPNHCPHLPVWDNEPVLIDLAKFCEDFPEILTDNPWFEINQRITLGEIRRAVRKLQPDEGATPTEVSMKAIWTRADHVRRVAYLFIHGWTDPIDVDVGCPSFGTGHGMARRGWQPSSAGSPCQRRQNHPGFVCRGRGTNRGHHFQNRGILK